MISIEEALGRILSYVDVLSAEQQPLVDALGQVLAADVSSSFDIPPLDNTAMDGYAVRAEDTAGATEDPVQLRVIGELAAGYTFDRTVEPGAAVRIMTGAPVPAGADAIVPFEETDEPFQAAPSGVRRLAAEVKVLKTAETGANIRRAGEDLRAGQVVVPKGTVLRPSEIGVIASVGAAAVKVIRRPVVAVLSTGDELLERAVGQRGQVYLRVPGGKSGAGKVLVNVQDRTVECQAVTAQSELPTGARVVVVSVVGGNTVEVVAADEGSTPGVTR